MSVPPLAWSAFRLTVDSQRALSLYLTEKFYHPAGSSQG